MKKELALSALAALLAVSIQTEIEKTEISTQNEVIMDMYVTGCQCSSPRKWKSDSDVIV